ncbi:MAG: hypothetical protein ACREFV_02115 [Acetobacteraceae bacterium]
MSRISEHFNSDPTAASRIEGLARQYRGEVRRTLEPLVLAYHPALAAGGQEYAKLLELSTKMMLVGHACTEIAGETFDLRRRHVAALFGCCCFLADSFLDDFGPAASREYLQRFDLLLRVGWFEIGTERERLFYIVLALLFVERNVLEPLLRQAIVRLHAAQAEDVLLRLEPARVAELAEPERREVLRRCAANRSGHAIVVLTSFLVPTVSLTVLSAIFAAGSLIMFIDDHGDCYADRADGRITYMNRLARPERALGRIFARYMERILRLAPSGEGRALMQSFLTRYYLTRVDKHRRQRCIGGRAWDVYE